MGKKKRGIYDTELKQDKHGYYRWIGKNQKGTRQQFRLGRNKKVAEKRLALIHLLHQQQAEAAKFYHSDWVPEFLTTAKAIGKGKKAVLPRLKLYVNDEDFIEQSPETYMKLLLALNKNGVIFEADEGRHLGEAVDSISKRQTKDRQLKSMLVGTNPDKNPTGQILADAIEAFKRHTEEKFTDHEGVLSAWGRKKLDYMKSIVEYIKQNEKGVDANTDLLNLDLADLTLTRCQQMIDSFRTRPKSIRSKFKKRLEYSSADGFRKVLVNFWDWLDLSDDWEWEKPSKFGKIETKIAELTDDETLSKKKKREEWELSDDEIKTLFNCSTPVERVLLLLGLNCAFGAAEIGGLRTSFLKLDKSEIDGIRFKTMNSSRHRLWPESIDALRFELSRRVELPQIERYRETVFINENGEPLWRKRKTGGYANGVAKRWNCLRKRVTKDDPSFRQFGFNRLRKTAAIRILRIADAEAASLILAHGVPSEDKLLKNYISIPWEKLYEAQERYGEEIRPLMTTSFDPFIERPKTYVGHGKRQTAIELRREGLTVKSIAEKIGVHVATVNRYLRDSEG